LSTFAIVFLLTARIAESKIAKPGDFRRLCPNPILFASGQSGYRPPRWNQCDVGLWFGFDLPCRVSRGSQWTCFLAGVSGPRRMTMSKNLYVGNLSFNTTADDLRDLFSQHGSVTSTQVISDRETGRSRGFGFVEMDDGAEAAISAVNGADFQGRALTVNEAKPREDRRSGGGYGGGGRY
jgi:hypothetical protein